MEPETRVRISYPAPRFRLQEDRLKIEFKSNEILWMLALCSLAEKGEFPFITLPYKTCGALVLSDGKWGIVPMKLREMLDKQMQAHQTLTRLGRSDERF